MVKEATASSIAKAFNKKYRELFQKYSSFHASYGCEKKGNPAEGCRKSIAIYVSQQRDLK